MAKKPPKYYIPSDDEISSTKSKHMRMVTDYCISYSSEYTDYCIAHGLTPPVADEDKIRFYYESLFNADGSPRVHAMMSLGPKPKVLGFESKSRVERHVKNEILSDSSSYNYVKKYVTAHKDDFEKATGKTLATATSSEIVDFFYGSQYDASGNLLPGVEEDRSKSNYKGLVLDKTDPTDSAFISGVRGDPQQMNFINQYCSAYGDDYNAYCSENGITPPGTADDQINFFYQDVYQMDGEMKPTSEAKYNSIPVGGTTKAPTKYDIKAPVHPVAEKMQTAELPLEQDDGKNYINGWKHIPAPKWLLGLNLILSFIPFLAPLALVGWGVFAALETDFFQHILPSKNLPIASCLEVHKLHDDVKQIDAENKYYCKNDKISSRISAIDNLIRQRDEAIAAGNTKEVNKLNNRISKYFTLKGGPTVPGSSITRVDFEKSKEIDPSKGGEYSYPYENVFNPYIDNEEELRRRKAASKHSFAEKIAGFFK